MGFFSNLFSSGKIKLVPQKTRAGVNTVMVDGRYAGSTVDKKTLNKHADEAEKTIRRINVEELTVEGFEDGDEMTEAVKTLVKLDQNGNIDALKDAMESYRKSDFLPRNKAMEYLAASRYEATLPEGWKATVIGQNNAHVPDISVTDENGVFQYNVEVKMPSSQALPIVLQKGEDGKWVTPEDADEYTTQRVAILNKPENLALYNGAEAVVTEDERTLMLDLFEKHLETKGTKYLYVVNLDGKKDITMPYDLITEDSRVSLTLRTPRPKTSGSKNIGAKKFDSVKTDVSNHFKDGIVELEKEQGKYRTFLYTDENLEAGSARRHVSEAVYISRGSDKKVKKVVNGVEKELYLYEVREKSAKPTEDQGYTSLGQLNITVD